MEIGVALTKLACPLCGATMDGDIIMNKVLTKSMTEKVEKMNGKILGYSNNPCSECQDFMKKGFLLIGYDEDKSNMHNIPEGIYYSGHKWVITFEAAKRIFPEDKLSKGVLLLSTLAAKKFGFIDNKI